MFVSRSARYAGCFKILSSLSFQHKNTSEAKHSFCATVVTVSDLVCLKNKTLSSLKIVTRTHNLYFTCDLVLKTK